MSNLTEHNAEQTAITSACEAGTCDHPECSPTWHEAALSLYQPGSGISDDDNAQRASRVLQAIYPAYDDWTAEAAVADVLCDLRHLCDVMGWDLFGAGGLNDDARRMYLQEVGASGVAQSQSLEAAITRDLT